MDFDKIIGLIPVIYLDGRRTEYILPEGAPEEEVWGSIRTDDKVYKTGRKEISFEEIKVEDNVFIMLNLKSDYTIEGIEVQVSPKDLFENL